MTSAPETLQTLLGIVVVEDVRLAGPPSATHPDTHNRVRLDVAYVASVAPLLSDHPHIFALQVIANDSPAPPAALPPDGFDHGVSRYQTKHHAGLDRGIDQAFLQQPYLPALPRIDVHFCILDLAARLCPPRSQAFTSNAGKSAEAWPEAEDVKVALVALE